jgi:hypothetical protein
MWISAAFNLKVIRTFDALHSASAATLKSDQVHAGVILLESAAKMLNLPILPNSAHTRSCNRSLVCLI